MNWIFVGILLGSIVTSQHDSKESCLGRQAILKEKGVNGQCVENRSTFNSTTGTLSICTSGHFDNTGQLVCP